jgi:UDP-glucose 4-epimerase
MANEILLIGGSGFAGRTILPHLLARYDIVHVLTKHSSNLVSTNSLKVYSNGINDQALIDKLLQQCNDVLYFASATTPGLSAGKPLLELNNNLNPLIHFIESLQRQKHIHLVYISSGGAIYGNVTNGMLNEEHEFFPRSYYGANKIAAEAFLQAYSRQFGNSVSILRPSNFYGVGQPYREGFGLIRTVFEHVLDDIPITIWGDGEITRDYIYIDDFVSACLILLKQRPSSGVNIYNVGSGTGTTINQVCDLVEQIARRQLKRIYKPIRSVDVMDITLDCSKLHRLGWNPHTTLEEGLNLMWAWLVNQSGVAQQR